MSLRIHEIFFSLQGESSRIGFPTIFIRLTGCPLRCQYCDTEYAFRGGNMMTEQEILQAIAQYPCKTVCVTGGEPLAQKACFGLLSTLADAGYQVSLETSGAMDIAEVDARVLVVMDIKTPDSAEVEKNLWGNIQHLKPLPVYGKGENIRDWLWVEDHASAIDVIFHGATVPQPCRWVSLSWCLERDQRRPCSS